MLIGVSSQIEQWFFLAMPTDETAMYQIIRFIFKHIWNVESVIEIVAV